MISIFIALLNESNIKPDVHVRLAIRLMSKAVRLPLKRFRHAMAMWSTNDQALAEPQTVQKALIIKINILYWSEAQHRGAVGSVDTSTVLGSTFLYDLLMFVWVSSSGFSGFLPPYPPKRCKLADWSD